MNLLSLMRPNSNIKMLSDSIECHCNDNSSDDDYNIITSKANVIFFNKGRIRLNGY